MAGDTKASKAKMEKAVQQSFAGDLEWLDEVIRDAGYINPSLGFQQSDVVSENVTSRKILREWELAGLDFKTINRKKFYPVWPFIRFMFSRRVKTGDKDAQEFTRWKTEEKRQSALEKKRKYEIAMGKLIDREDADKKFIELILHAISAMETAFGGIAPQLVNKTVENIRKELEKRIDWLCQEMQNNRTPVPSKLAAEKIKRIVREEVGKTG